MILPTFNSKQLKQCISSSNSTIPDLSEHFIYFNDDMLPDKYKPTKIWETFDWITYMTDHSSAKKGIWGINDVDLLKNVLDKVDSKEKSLNLILTISNHPPFEENVFEYGFNFD